MKCLFCGNTKLDAPRKASYDWKIKDIYIRVRVDVRDCSSCFTLNALGYRGLDVARKACREMSK